MTDERKPLTPAQRQRLRGIIRREADRLGYRSGYEMRHQPARVRELHRIASKLPIYETPTGYMPTQAELDALNAQAYARGLTALDPS